MNPGRSFPARSFPVRSALSDVLDGGKELRHLLPAVVVAERDPDAAGQTRREPLLRDESLPALFLPAQP